MRDWIEDPERNCDIDVSLLDMLWEDAQARGISTYADYKNATSNKVSLDNIKFHKFSNSNNETSIEDHENKSLFNNKKAFKLVTEGLENKRVIENSNRYRRLKKGLFGDPSGKIKTFAIISAENPLGWKNSTEEEFKQRFVQWFDDKKLYNKQSVDRIESTILLHKIEETGNTGLRYGGFVYVPLKGKYGDLEKSYIIFNLTLSDAKTIASDYGQESFFFANVKEDKSTIAYYVTSDGCKTYKLVDVSETISDETDARDYFSKFGFKFRINMREFGDEIPEITDRAAFEESFDEENRNFSARALKRRQSMKKQTIEEDFKKSNDMYYRFEVFDDKGQNKGGIFRGLNQLLKDLWEEDSEYYDYINDPLSKLEWLTPNPENIDDINTKFAYKESFYNQNKELFEDIEYALSEIGWELATIELSRPNTIIYEDNTQIAYIEDSELKEDLTEAFEIHDELNSQVFDLETGKMHPELRDRLVQIADLFVESIKDNEIPIDVVDYILIGSSAAYNYTEFSDIDLHVLVDLSKIKGLNPILLKILYNYIKGDFNTKYDIKVKGRQVEVYLQDIEEENASAGVYSLLKDEWVKFPNKEEPRIIDIENTDLFNYWLLKYRSLTPDDIDEFISQLYDLRKSSLKKDGEFGLGNLIFKEFRNRGYLQNLKDKKYEVKSKELSLF